MFKDPCSWAVLSCVDFWEHFRFPNKIVVFSLKYSHKSKKLAIHNFIEICNTLQIRKIRVQFRFNSTNDDLIFKVSGINCVAGCLFLL